MIYPAYGDAIDFFRQGDQWLQSNGVPAHAIRDAAVQSAGPARYYLPGR
jgi:hypothetical protein